MQTYKIGIRFQVVFVLFFFQINNIRKEFLEWRLLSQEMVSTVCNHTLGKAVWI